MSPGAWVFLVFSWSFVLGLTIWSWARILRSVQSTSDAALPAGGTPDENVA